MTGIQPDGARQVELIVLSDHGEVRELRLNRPPVNALSPELVNRIRQIVQEAAGIELIDQVAQKILQFRLGCDACLVGHQLVRGSAIGCGPPFVRHHHDGLCEVE